MMRVSSNCATLLLLFIIPIRTVALREVFVDHDEEDRLVLIVDGPIEKVDQDDLSLRKRQRQLRGDEISLSSSIASGQPAKMQWWNQAYTYIAGDSSWNKPSATSQTFQSSPNTASARTTSNYFNSGNAFLFPQARQQPQTSQRVYTPPRPQDQQYTPYVTTYVPPETTNNAPQLPQVVASQARTQQQPLPAARSGGGGVTLSRVYSNADTLQDASSRYGKPTNFQYMNPEHDECWPRGDQPLDLYSPDTCCFLCRSGHNPTKPTRGVVVGANEHGLKFTGTCTGLHEHMRVLQMKMSDSMCKITQITFAEYCCAGELEVSTNWGTWTVK